MHSSTRSLILCAVTVFAVLFCGAAQAQNQSDLKVTGADLPANDSVLKLLQSVPWSFSLNPVEDRVPSRPAFYILYVTGTDIYGNNVYLPVSRGPVPSLNATSFEAQGTWVVPNDGTLYNLIAGGYRFTLSVFYGTAPANLAALNNPDLTRSTRIFIDVVPNIAIDAPGVVYRAGTYRGGDIAQFQSIYLNSPGGETGAGGRKQSRPLRPGRDRYTLSIRLSGNAEYHEVTDVPVIDEEDRADAPNTADQPTTTTPPTTTADDFSLMAAVLSGDLGAAAAPDGYSPVRKVEVTGTPPALLPYGISGPAASTILVETQRVYTPQPYDGWLDIGEEVTVWSEQLIPQNYTGNFFVTSRVQMNNPALDASTANNTFTSDAANKITLEEPEQAPPTLDMVSSTPDLGATSPDSASPTAAAATSGGNQQSDDGVASGDGGVIAFASRATDLALTAQGPTKGQQIFLRYRQSRETQLVSRTVANVQANKDCFNPAISANGRYTAFDSTASNLARGATTGRSMVYVYDKDTFTTVVVSKNAFGQIGNGNSYRPSLSSSGRFVAFESEASNLDLPVAKATVSGGAIIRVDSVRKGFGYNRLNPPTTANGGITVIGSGRGANISAVVDVRGQISSYRVNSLGSGYAENTQIRIAPPVARFKQIYLHDRDANENGVFDEDGKTATYLVSINRSSFAADQLCNQPVVNLDDTEADLAANGGMFVAFVSYAQNMPNTGGGSGNAMVYRTLVDVTNDTGQQVVDNIAFYPRRGAVANSVDPVSVNDLGEPADVTGGDVDLVGAQIVPFAIEPSINGDGSQIAFSSAAVNLVYNEQTLTYVPTYPNQAPTNPNAPPVAGVVPAGDYNRVPDVFVRDMNALTTRRVSIARERVATGTIEFAIAPWSRNPQPGGNPAGNIPPANGVLGANQVAAGDNIQISDGVRTLSFVFGPATAPNISVPIGANIQQTRDNLIDEINSSALKINAFASTPPNAVAPGSVGYRAGIYLRNEVAGTGGNRVITVGGAVQSGVFGLGANRNIFINGMRGGGIQGEEDARFPGLTALSPTQRVPLGSGQPSIDRSGRRVAFRSVCVNLDVFVLTSPNNSPTLPPFQRANPITGELIRPLYYTLTSNVYLHDRDADADAVYDENAGYSTTRVSVNKFGYPTNIYPIDAFGRQALRRGFTDTANSSNPSLSADGRFVIFSSDSEGPGGLDFGQSNLEPLDNTKKRDVFVQDRFTVGEDPALDDVAPTVAFASPTADTAYVTGTTVLVSVNAQPARGKTIRNVIFTVNGTTLATVTAAPYLVALPLSAPGTYNVTALVTDNFGVQTTQSVAVLARRAVGEAPTIAVTHPTPGGGGDTANDFSTASSFFLNALAAPGSGSVIDFISRINLEAGGSGYTSAPSVRISAPGGSGTTALARAIVEAGRVVALQMVDGGSGYTAAPTVTFSGGGGTGARATAVVNTPQFFANGILLGGNIVRINIPKGGGGSNYKQSAPPAVVITGGGGSGARAQAIVGSNGVLDSIKLIDGGIGYTSAPTVTIAAPVGGGTRATATAVVGGALNRLDEQYGIFWRPDVIGNYQITAQVTDSRGNTVVSTPLEFEIASVIRPLPTVTMRPIANIGSFKTGSEILLEANFKANSLTEVARVDFYANSVFIGAWEPPSAAQRLAGTASITWVPQEPGNYTIAARAMQVLGETGDNSIVSNSVGLKVVEATGIVGQEPVIFLTDPVSEPRLVRGSSAYLNVTATDPDPDGKVVDVQIYVNGQPVSVGNIRRYGDTWSTKWVPTQVGNYEVTATAEDDKGNVSVLPRVSFIVVQARRQLPEVRILNPITTGTINTSQPILLRALARFPAGAAEFARVDFYANGVLVGTGTRDGAVGADGFAAYQLVWQPLFTASKVRVSAKATSQNYEDDVFGLTSNENITVIESDNEGTFGSVLTRDETPAFDIVGIPIVVPGSNEAFVDDLYKKLLETSATPYDEWKYYVDRLSRKQMTRAQVVMALMGYSSAEQKFNFRSPYGQTSAMAFAAYHRLGLAPTAKDIDSFVEVLFASQALAAPLPLNNYPAAGLPAPPYGATVGLGQAFQQLVESAGFSRKYPLMTGLTNQRFVLWLRDVVFPRRPLGQLVLISGVGGGVVAPPPQTGTTITSTTTGNTTTSVIGDVQLGQSGPAQGLMESPDVLTPNTQAQAGANNNNNGNNNNNNPAPALLQPYPQGAAMAFLSRLVVAAYSVEEKTFQRRMAVSALRFQLSSIWDPNLYKNPQVGEYSEKAVEWILKNSPPVGGTMALARAARSSQLAGIAGTYKGSLGRGALNKMAGGSINLQVSTTGAVTGTITMNGRDTAFVGSVDAGGKITGATKGVPGARSYVLNLRVQAPGSVDSKVTGNITSGRDSVQVNASVANSRAVQQATKVRSMAGRYEGVVDRSALNKQAGGSIRINTDAKGAVTGQVLMGGKTLPFRGKVDHSGRITARTDAVKGQSHRYDVALQLAKPGSPSAASVTGAISAGKLKANVRALISPWSNRQSAATYSGTFKLTLSPPTNGRKLDPAVPIGPRTGQLTVKNDGTVLLTGQLGRSAPLSWTGRLTGDGRVLLQSSVKANGSVMGTLVITNKAGRKSVSGTLSWTKPAAGKQKGFSVELKVSPR